MDQIDRESEEVDVEIYTGPPDFDKPVVNEMGAQDEISEGEDVYDGSDLDDGDRIGDGI